MEKKKNSSGPAHSETKLPHQPQWVSEIDFVKSPCCLWIQLQRGRWGSSYLWRDPICRVTPGLCHTPVSRAYYLPLASLTFLINLQGTCSEKFLNGALRERWFPSPCTAPTKLSVEGHGLPFLFLPGYLLLDHRETNDRGRRRWQVPLLWFPAPGVWAEPLLGWLIVQSCCLFGFRGGGCFKCREKILVCFKCIEKILVCFLNFHCSSLLLD